MSNNWKVYHPDTLRVVAERRNITVGALLKYLALGAEEITKECNEEEALRTGSGIKPRTEREE